MPLYTCEYCNFSSKYLGDNKRHLNTMKHQRNTKGISSEHVKNTQKRPQKDQKETILGPQKDHKKTIFGHKNDLFEPLNTIEPLNICEYCDKKFKHKTHLYRHMKKYCKVLKNDENDIAKLELIINEQKKDKEDLKKHIELLITKVGNTTTNITNTQNIQLNSYGNEDMSHISDSLMRGLLKLPYGMIPKMIEAVHFSDNKPENKNISFPNKKDNKIKIYRGNKWIYKDKDSIINDLIDGKYFIMDSYYEEVCNKMSDGNRVSYEEFRKVFDREDKELHEDIKKDCELVLLNNR